jgi:hypothetical protein
LLWRGPSESECAPFDADIDAACPVGIRVGRLTPVDYRHAAEAITVADPIASFIPNRALVFGEQRRFGDF